ncbi:MAG: M1 family metallopeptidase [Myxococcales bacterium]|nr:M1 family metallopeptidase [Myxococcales bacterium]
MARALLLLVCVLAACGDGLGPPRPRPAPTPDAVPALRVPGARSPRNASYTIDARYDAAAHRIQATQTLTWRNVGGSDVTTLPFHLYLNGFKNETSLFMISSHGEHRGNEPRADGWGWIDVTSIQIAGVEQRARATFEGPDETVLVVPAAVPAGGTIEIAMTFTAQLPRVMARTGYEGAFAMVGQWFPKIGVRVGATGFEAWDCPPFHAHSEFFADFGVYDVALTVPDTHVVAATGVLAAVEDHEDHTRTLRYHAEDVHDFAWMIDPYMRVMSATAQVEGGPVEVRVVYRPRQRDFARRHLAAGVGAIETFSKLFVPYPWSVMTVIDPPPEAMAAGGMEYPTLVTSGADNVLMRPGIRLPEFVTIHEIGHNWFQGILASNESREAWLDEGVNEWADGIVMARLYGEKQSLIDWGGWKADGLRLRRAASGDLSALPSAIASTAAAFPDFDSYAAATYTKTAVALRTLERVIDHDQERFVAAMRQYAITWAFRHPTGADLFASLEATLGEDLDWFVQPAFQHPGGVDFAVRTASCARNHPPRGVFGEGAERRTVVADHDPDTGGYRCRLVVENRGTIPVPVTIELRYDDGTHEQLRWEHRDTGRWFERDFARSSPIAEVVIDPEGEVLLADRTLDDQLRMDGDRHAAWRATARITSWTQGLMQVVGL